MSIVNIQALKQLGNVLWWPGQVSMTNSPKSISANGDCKQILPFPSAGIGMFDGTGDYLSIPNNVAFDFSGGGNYTFEFYISFADLTLRRNILSKYTDDSNLWQVYWHPTNGIGFAAQVSGSWVFTFNQGAVTGWVVNTLYHIAVVHSGTTYTIYRDGVSVATTTDVDNIPYLSGSPLYIGTGPFEAAGTPYYKLNGNLSELRVSNVARYTAAFTPLRRQLESDSNTKLLIHFNRNDTTFIDSSPSAHTITRYGDAKQLCSPCGSGVAYFDGTGDYLSFTNSNFGTGDITIEGYIKLTATSNDCTILMVNQSTLNYQYFGLYYDHTNGLWVDYSDGSTHPIDIRQGGITGWVAGTWYHVCFIRSGNTGYIFRNGVLLNSGAAPSIPSYTSGTVGIISGKTGLAYPMNGYVSELQVSNSAKYNVAGFTPSTTPFRPDPYTKLLLHMDGVGNAFYDSSDPPGDNGFPILPDGVTVTPSGTFTTQKMKDGRNIWKFDGSTNYVSLADNDTWVFYNGDFTIAFWAKLSNITSNKMILGQASGDPTYLEVYWSSSNGGWQIVGKVTTTYFNHYAAVTPTVDTWYHIAYSKTGTTLSIYINGSPVTVTVSTAWNNTMPNISSPLYIGYDTWSYMGGNIKDLMIFKGKALSVDQIAAIMKETYIY